MGGGGEEPAAAGIGDDRRGFRRAGEVVNGERQGPGGAERESDHHPVRRVRRVDRDRLAPRDAGGDQAAGEQMVEAMEQCGSSIDAIYEGFARDSETNELDPEMLACMQETAPVAEFRAAMVTSFTGDDDAALIAVGKKWEACS